jgi:hypothetical protein
MATKLISKTAQLDLLLASDTCESVAAKDTKQQSTRLTGLLKGFIYKDELYIRCIPVKALFNSNLIHGATVRGDIFAMRVSDQGLTIVPGKAQVQHVILAKDLVQASMVLVDDPR